MMTGVAVPEDDKKVTEEELKELVEWSTEQKLAVCRCKCGASFSSRYQLLGSELKVWTQEPCPTCSRHDQLWAALVDHDDFDPYHHTLVRVPTDPNMIPPR